VGPLGVVLFIAILKEGVEDVTRFLRDREINMSEVDCFDIQTGTWVGKSCQDLLVGDVIRVKERVPSDCVILNSTCVEGDIYIKTDQLDGETDWKQKRAVHMIEKL